MKVGFHIRTRDNGAGRLNRFGGSGLVLWMALLVVALESTMVLPASGAIVADDYTSLNLEQLMAIPVYSAAKREQNTSEAPSSVTVITSQDVRAYGWRTLSDLLRSVPGIYVTYGRSYGAMGVRGFDRGDFGGRTLLLLNGHRMNDPLYDTAAIMEDFILDLDLIDRVEIVRGPGSTLYGTNALFAVVNVLTKTAKDYEGFEASGEVGTMDTYRGRLTFGTRGDDGAELLLSASGMTSGGRDEVYMPRFDGDNGFDGVLHNGDSESVTRYSGSHRRGGLTVEGFYAGRDKDSPPIRDYGNPGHLPRHLFDERGFVEGRYEHALTADATLAARLYYDWYRYVGTYVFDVDEPEFVTNRDDHGSESIGGELQVSWRPWTSHAATAGFEYRDNYRQAMKNFNIDPYATITDFDQATQILGLYLQDEYRPSASLGITGGVRYDYYDTFGESVNPRLAVVYDVIEATTVKLLYGEAFRAPNANEFYYEEEADGYSVVRNPDLQPEEISTYEIVCEQQFGLKWRGSVASFYYEATDLIGQQEIVDEMDGDDVVHVTYYSDNMDKVYARGLEFHADGQLTERTRVSASYTYTETEDAATGEPLGGVPKRLGKINLTAPVLPGVMVGVEAQYVSDRIRVSGRNYDSHWLVNATLFSARWKDRLEGSLSVYNLFEAVYNNQTIGDLVALQDGRLLRLKVGLRF
jgi:outer membrane receptor for ferrienterochelin and colicins